jgi:hypothetical protein
MAKWVNDCRSELAEAMKGAKKEVIKESELMKAKDSGRSLRRKNYRAIHDRTDGHWSLHGRYSLYPSRLQTGGAGFTLTVVDCTLDEWMENALTDKVTKPGPLGRLQTMKASRFGLRFEKDDGHGSMAKTWPVVAAIDHGDTIAAEFPSIKTGCTLRKINGEDAPATFKQALKMLKARPLKLEFSSAVAEHTNEVTAWHHAALLEIGLVRRHEAMKLLKHRRFSPGCNKPHCIDDCCREQHECTLTKEMSAGWLKLSDPSSSFGTARDSRRVTLAPEPEPEPELQQLEEMKPESGTQMTVSKSFVQRCVCLAAEHAGVVAVALLRSYEAPARIEEGEPQVVHR